MRKEILIRGQVVTLDSESLYSGAAQPAPQEKLVRKAVGLPVTKQLVYYTDKRDAKSVVPVTSYRVKECFETSDTWYVLDVVLNSGETVSIHSSYFIEMQRPSFIADMEKQAKAAFENAPEQ